MMPDQFLDGDVVSNRLQVWNTRLSRPQSNQFVCVAEDREGLVGFICVFGGEDPIWGSCIDNLHVSSSRKRSGLGMALMQHAAAWLSRHHPQVPVYLWVMEANSGARRFYERLGASNAGTFEKSNPSGGSAPNCRYVWAGPEQLINAR